MATHTKSEQPSKKPGELCSERRENLLKLAVGPGIWVSHLLASYVTVALYCAKVAPKDGPLSSSRWLVLAYTVAALVGIAWIARDAYRRHRFGTGAVPHDFDTPQDRHRFLGFAGFLLAIISFVGVLYVALPFAFVSTCR